MGVSFDKGLIEIDTPDLEDARRVLKKYAPWRHRIDFKGGVSSTDYENFKPFNAAPTWKIQRAEMDVGEFSAYRRALDIGCNAGYNSIYLAARYGMEVIGVDFWKRHVEVSTELARLAGVQGCKFMVGNAETFHDPVGFDLIIHFGTLYHLKNPVLALETALKNLRPGGMMLIETQLYGEPHETRAEFIYGQGGDNTDWWALGEQSLIKMCEVFGARAEFIGKRFKLPTPDQYRGKFKVTKPQGKGKK